MQANLGFSPASLEAERRALTERLLPLAIFGVALLVALLIRYAGLRLLYRKVSKQAHFGLVFLNAIRVPSVLWCIVVALDVALRYAPLTGKQIGLANTLIVAFLIISFTLVVSSVSVRILAVYGERNQMAFAVAGLPRALTRVFVLSLGALILLHHFNISITPLLTALGVGGLAVALALQDTLANFFAGVHILVEAPIGIGDFIRLSSGEEGVVTDIGWRTTRLRTNGNNMVVVPNQKITSGILTNFSVPDRRVVAEIAVLAALDADAHQVAECAIEAAAETEGILTDPAPMVLFDPGVTPTHMQFKLLVHVHSQLEKGPIQSSIRVKLLDKFKSHGIPLPSQEKLVVVRS